MSSSDSKLPPSYSEIPASTGNSSSNAQITANRIAGTVQTCSIKDGCVDYFKIIRHSPTSYSLCLTVDPTPIYRIEFVSDSSKIGDIQVFPAFDTSLPPVAAARLSSNPKNKSEPVAMICTSEPFLPDAHWRPVTRASSLSVESYRSSIPIITVPGIAPKPHQFAWRAGGLSEPFVELWWDGPLPMVPSAMFMHDQRGAEYIFTTMARKNTETGENLIEIRRGGGLDFELSVVLELFVILHHQKKQFV